MVFKEFMGPCPKTLSSFRGSALIMAISFELTLQIRGFPPFSGLFSVIMCLSRSVSVQRSLLASPDLIAVSFRSWRNVAVFFPQPAIRASSSFSVGMKGIFRVTLHFGFSHCRPLSFRKRLYAFMTLRLLLADQFCLAMISLIDSGLFRLALRLDSVLMQEMFPRIVASAYPCFFIHQANAMSFPLMFVVRVVPLPGLLPVGFPLWPNFSLPRRIFGD